MRVQVDHSEVEWQFDAADVRPVERWLRARVPEARADPAQEAPDGLPIAGETLVVAEARPVTHVDTYMDTPDWRIHRAGYSLRIRRERGVAQATLKSFSPPSEGLRRRREVSETLPSEDPEELRRSEGPLGQRIRAVVGGTSLGPLFEVRTRRRAFDLTLDGAAAGEVVLDETTIPVGNGSTPARLKRVEVEVQEPFMETVSGFVEAMRDECGLRPASLSKYETALLSRGLQPDRPLELGPTLIDPTLSVGEVAFAVMRRHFEAFMAKEPGTRLGEDPEELHDMRVANRRLRAAIAMFRTALPVRAVPIREELRWVAQALGVVRDLDVQVEQLDSWSKTDLVEDPHALRAIRDLLERDRAQARIELLKVLDSPRYARLLGRMSRFLRAGPLRHSPASRARIAGAGSTLLRRRYRAVTKAGDGIGEGASAADYHRVRIRSKRLRYALEFLAEVYPGKTERLTRRLVALQGLLGMQQDADVAVRRLRALATENGGGLPPRAAFAMGMIAERYVQQGRRLRGRFPKVYGRVRGKPSKELRLVMKQRMPVPAPPE